MPTKAAPLLALLFFFSFFSSSACSSQDGPGDGGGDPPDLGAGQDGLLSTDGATACPRLPTADDAERSIVVAHPYAATTGMKATDYERLLLDGSGAITRPGHHFSMGRAAFGNVVFTPDGELGFVAQEDGSIGSFRLRPGMTPEVIESGHMRAAYASFLWVSPAGDRLYVLDSNTEANGGGVYELPILCDGTLGATTKLSAAELPYAMVGLKGGDLALYARQLPGAGLDEAVHRVKLGPPFQRLASVVPFSAAVDKAVVSSAEVTLDGKWVLFADNSEFSGVPTRIVAAAVTASGLGATQEIAVNDPVALIASPYDNAVLVSSGYDNALVALGYDPQSATTPLSAGAPISYMGKKPQLPGSAVSIVRGALRGRVYVAENLGIRQVRFNSDGSITDLGLHGLGMGFEQIVGAIGITR
jgi:hypothetical protein